MKNAMTENIHVQSFREFISRRLPAALAAVIPLADYQVEWLGEGKGRVTFSVGNNGLRLVFDDLPFPYPDGSFAGGSGRVVVLSASSNNLEEAEIKAVGEQLIDIIGPRLSARPDDLEWDEQTLRAWLPLDKWMQEVLLEGAIETSQWLDLTNCLARQTHLRRILIMGNDVSFHPSHIGRVCPIETPEGPNCGHWVTLANGADIQNGRIVPAEDQEAGALGLTASLVPLLCHNDTTRQLIGANMMRQMIPPEKVEAPLVQSGLEPPDGSSFVGRNFLTAFLPWKGMNYEDAIVLSETAAARLASPPWNMEIGDKLSNRHGTKGVIGAILPDDEMPHLPDGRAVELLFDAIGVYSRLNFGQILEASLGLIAEKTGQPFIAPPFMKTTPQELHTLLREAGLPETGQFQLRDGKHGPELDEPTTVGMVYWGKLVHIARSKVHALSLQGRASGQRAGRNEYLALRSVGAIENILDAYGTRAMPQDEGALLRRVANGFLTQRAAPPSPAFKELQQVLRLAMIEMEFTGAEVRFNWREDTGSLSVMKLAEPMEHPWRAGMLLEKVVQPEILSPAFERLIAANEQLKEAFEKHAPEAAQEMARTELRRALENVFAYIGEQAAVKFAARGYFTGRAVLAPGYDLKLGQVGLPEDIVWPLFGPLTGSQVGLENIHERGDRVKSEIERVMQESMVIINRAPTWEPTSITAFKPIMVPGHAILLHPLCCRLFNADFDGDQAAVWLPLSRAAQQEAREKLSLIGHLRRDPGTVLAHLTPALAIMAGLAYAMEGPEGQAELSAGWPGGCELPEPPLTRGQLLFKLTTVLEKLGPEALLELLDRFYHLGTKWATRSGASYSPCVGEGLRLPSPPTSQYTASWYSYASIVEAAITAQADTDATLKAPMRAIRSGARGAVSHLRVTVGPWAAETPYATKGPITHGFRDGMTPPELWLLVERSRQALLGIVQEQNDLAVSFRFSGDGSVLRRALASQNAASIFAEAADQAETDPLTDQDVRLWLGLHSSPE
jgi:hypothetical protein